MIFVFRALFLEDETGEVARLFHVKQSSFSL
jgi:hypothetical protein